MIESIIIALVALVIGSAGGYAFFRYVVKGKFKEVVDAAAKEAEVLKEKKLLEVNVLTTLKIIAPKCTKL